MHTVVDCATARPEENMMSVDWEGKVALMKSAKAMGIERYIFYSIARCEQYHQVPLMQVKHRTEQYLQQLGLKYTIVKLCGFMQSLVFSYAGMSYLASLEEVSILQQSCILFKIYLLSLGSEIAM